MCVAEVSFVARWQRGCCKFWVRRYVEIRFEAWRLILAADRTTRAIFFITKYPLEPFNFSRRCLSYWKLSGGVWTELWLGKAMEMFSRCGWRCSRDLNSGHPTYKSRVVKPLLAELVPIVAFLSTNFTKRHSCCYWRLCLWRQNVCEVAQKIPTHSIRSWKPLVTCKRVCLSVCL